MSKRRNKSFNQMYSNDDEEVNIKDYPYYRTIPIQSLGDKQKRMLERSQVAQDIKGIPYEEQTIIPAAPVAISYQSQAFENLPTFNMVKMEGTNCYRVDMTPHFEPYSEDLKKTKEHLTELEQEIKKNNDIIEGQKQAINTNHTSIEQQVAQINSNNQAIQSNTAYIQQQVTACNHNSVVLHNQGAQYSANNTEIIRQQQTLAAQYNQIAEQQAQLEQLQSDVQSYQEQLSYHGAMLNAFNTLIQNPVYFTQLMTAAASFNPDVITEVNDIQYSDSNTT